MPIERPRSGGIPPLPDPRAGAPEQLTITWPVIPVIPPTVAIGDLITSAHENQVRQALDDLWVDLQSLNLATITDPTTTLGDLMVRSGTMITRLGVGANGQMLVADSLQPLGMAWVNPAFVPVTRLIIAGAGLTGGGNLSADVTLNADMLSVNGRIGAVVLNVTDLVAMGGVPDTRQVLPGTGMTGGGPLIADVTLNADVWTVFGRTGDVVLTAADIVAAGGVLTSRQILTGRGLMGGGDLSVDRTLSVLDDTSIQQIEVSKGTLAGIAGTHIGTRRQINFIEGAGAAVNIFDDPVNNKVDIIIDASGAGGGATGAFPVEVSIDGTAVGIQPEINFLTTGTNMTLTGVENIGASSIELTFNSTVTQTPWLQDIDGATFWLRNTGGIGIGNDATVPPSVALAPRLIVGDTAGISGEVAIAASAATLALMGGFTWANYAIGGAEKRIASIHARVGAAANSGDLAFFTADTGIYGERVTITASGNVGIGNAMTALPDALAATHLAVGSASTATAGEVSIISMAPAIGALAGGYAWANYAILAAEKRIAAINAATDTTLDSGAIVFRTATGGILAERARITAAGRVGIGIAAPAWMLDVNGDINLYSPGTYRIDGVPIAGAGAGGHVIQEEGIPLTARANLNFTGPGVTATDDVANNASRITITGQTPWLSNIDGAGFMLFNPSQIGINVALPITRLHVSGGASGLAATSAQLFVEHLSDCYIEAAAPAALSCGYRMSRGTADTASLIDSATSLRLAATANQPIQFFTGTAVRVGIDIAGNVGIESGIGVPNADPAVHLVVGGGIAGRTGHLTAAATATATGSPVGSFGFANYFLGTADKRVASITGILDGAADSGALAFTTAAVGIPAEKMRVTAIGNVGVGNPGIPPYGAPAGAAAVIVGTPTAAGGDVVILQQVPGTNSGMGLFAFANSSIAAAEKRVAALSAVVENTPDSGALRFLTWNTGILGERMRVTARGNVGIGNDVAVLPYAAGTTPLMVVGSRFGTASGQFVVATNTPGGGVSMGGVLWANYSIAAVEKRMAAIVAIVEGTPDTGSLQFVLWNGGVAGERMRILPAGGLVLQGLPSVNPPLGSQQLWYDPADGNRVKFQP